MYMLVLRVIHILAGVLWAGWAFSLVGFIEPAARAAGPDGGKFMQALAGKTKIVPAMTVAPLLVIITGLLMFWPASGGLDGEWFASRTGLALTIGSLDGILAFIVGLAINRPAAARLAALSKEMQSAGGPPSPEQLAEFRAQQQRLSKGGLIAAILLAISVVGMSISRHVYFG